MHQNALSIHLAVPVAWHCSQENFFVQWIVVNTESHNLSKGREYMNCNGGMDRLETSRESPSFFFNFFHIVYANSLIHSSTDTPLCCFHFESSINKAQEHSWKDVEWMD